MHEVNAGDFRQELFGLIAKTDAEWPGDAPPGSSKIVIPEQSAFGTVAKALHSIQCFPRREGKYPAPEIPWIRFRSWGGAYHPRSMVEALQRRLSEKREKYRSNNDLKSLAEFVLIVHYDQALLYNSPVDAPDFGFDDAIEEARAFLGNDPGAFTRIFVLIAIEPGGRVFQLHP